MNSNPTISLTRRPRLRESIIFAFLFFCGALSIFTTIGIVYELSKELLVFFTSTQWENTNKSLSANVDEFDTTLPVTAAGASLQAG